MKYPIKELRGCWRCSCSCKGCANHDHCGNGINCMWDDDFQGNT